MERTQIWSSGGGVQSAAIAALIVQGKLHPDLGVIVDTGREQSTTWKYMDEVITPALAQVGFILQRVQKEDYATVDLYGGADGETLLMPVFTNQSGEIGKLPTYCSNEWKTRVTRRWATDNEIDLLKLHLLRAGKPKSKAIESRLYGDPAWKIKFASERTKAVKRGKGRK